MKNCAVFLSAAGLTLIVAAMPALAQQGGSSNQGENMMGGQGQNMMGNGQGQNMMGNGQGQNMMGGGQQDQGKQDQGTSGQ